MRGKLTDAQTKAQQYKQQTEKELKGAVDSFDSKAQAKARELRDIASQEAKEVNKEIATFDKTVERKASEAKNGISSWLGFGGK